VQRTLPPSAEIEAQIDQLLAVGVGENPRESLAFGVVYRLPYRVRGWPSGSVTGKHAVATWARRHRGDAGG
jgi:hypothetical protein